MFRSFSLLLFRLIGWKVEDHRPRDLGQCIYVVAPHTSNLDFVLGVFARSIARLSHVNFLGKSSLFKPPFGWIFRSLGGPPVDRSKNNNLVPQAVEYFRTVPTFSLAITPEGTRRKVARWRTGFYHIAHQASVPLVLTAFDYPTRRVIFHAPIRTTGNMDQDIADMQAVFRQFKGKHPENGVV